MAKDSSEYKVVSVFLNCLLFFTIVAIAALSCSKINDRLNLKDDHIGEELIENIIENKIGFSIDLTPLTIE